MPLSPPLASMGFVGYVRVGTGSSAVQVRARSADIRLSQAIEKPDVVDGRFDRTVYQLMPKIVEGSIEFPSIMESVGAGEDPTTRLYRLAAKRNFPGDGKLTSEPIAISYTNRDASFLFNDCIINQFRWSVEQQDVVSVNVDVIGLEREATTWEPMIESNRYFPQQSRIVTWNDAVVEVTEANDAFNYDGRYVRSFEMTLNNNAERYYTLNGRLFPQDIAPRKRDIEGSITFMGRLPELAEQAQTNEDRCSEIGKVKFGYQLTNALCSGTFLVTLPNCVFEIEELQLTNDIFETTVNWHCLPNVLDLTSAAILDTGS